MQRSLQFVVDNRLPEIRDRLSKVFPRRIDAPTDPLRQLIYSVICEGLAPAAGVALFNRLKAQFPSWRALRDSDIAALEDILVGVPSATKKAKALPALLKEIERREGNLDLDCLARRSTDSAQHWLESLPGVTSQAASAVLAFSTLARPVVPIDRDSARPLRRLGLAPEGAPISALPRHVVSRSPGDWDASDFSGLSESLRRLGRSVCREDAPACDDCSLADLCPTQDRRAGHVLAFRPR